LATVTPLASIFGSGLLIIVPILERELGAMAALGMAGVCAVAWMVGSAIRHNVGVVEPLAILKTVDGGRVEVVVDVLQQVLDRSLRAVASG